MGKGDKRTKRGKIIAGSFGNIRPKASKIRKEKAAAEAAAPKKKASKK